jgi:hypothetical protein
MARAVRIGLTTAGIVAPFILWLATGSVGWLGVIYAVEALVTLLIRWVARSLGLPAWSANEAYVSRLRRWNQSRRHT